MERNGWKWVEKGVDRSGTGKEWKGVEGQEWCDLDDPGNNTISRTVAKKSLYRIVKYEQLPRCYKSHVYSPWAKVLTRLMAWSVALIWIESQEFTNSPSQLRSREAKGQIQTILICDILTLICNTDTHFWIHFRKMRFWCTIASLI